MNDFGHIEHLCDWKRHYFTHSDEKPHKCSMCPKSFIRADQLRKHEAKVHSSGTAATNVKREDLKPEPVQQDHNTNPYFMQFNLSWFLLILYYSRPSYEKVDFCCVVWCRSAIFSFLANPFCFITRLDVVLLIRRQLSTLKHLTIPMWKFCWRARFAVKRCR